MYRRWDDEKDRYLNFPFADVEYEIRQIGDEDEKVAQSVNGLVDCGSPGSGLRLRARARSIS